jgi:hypothetical protein
MKVLKIETRGINKGHAGYVFSTEEISSIRFSYSLRDAFVKNYQKYFVSCFGFPSPV